MKTSLLTAAALVALPSMVFPAAADIAAASGCQACHAPDVKMLGPTYKAIAEKYRAQDSAAEQLFAAVREGSSGAWGQVPMMAFGAQIISDEDLESLIQWILEHDDSGPESG